MKKILVGMILVGAVLLGAAPYFVGKVAKEQIEILVADLNNRQDVSVAISEYHKRWFSSDVELALSVVDPQVQELLGEENSVWTVDATIKHGPILTGEYAGTGIFSFLIALHDQDNSLIKKQQDGPLYQMSGRMTWNTLLQYFDKTVPFIIEDEPSKITVGAYQGRGQYKVGGDFSYAAVFPDVDVASEEFSMAFSGAKLELFAELSQLYRGLIAPGKMSLRMAKMDITGEPSMQLSDLSMSSTTAFNLADGLAMFDLESTAQYRIEEADEYGDLHVKIVFDRVHLDFLEGAISHAEAMQADPTNVDPTVFLSLVTEKLLPASPVIKIDPLSLNTNAGNLKGNIALSIDGEAAKQIPSQPFNPFALIPLIQFDAVTTIDRSLANKLAEQHVRQQAHTELANMGIVKTEAEIDEMVKSQAPVLIQSLILQGFLVEKESSLHSNLQFKNGEATVNGQPMPLPF